MRYSEFTTESMIENSNTLGLKIEKNEDMSGAKGKSFYIYDVETHLPIGGMNTFRDNINGKSAYMIWEVYAEKRYGPLLYYFAMVSHQWIMPGGSNEQSSKIWQYFHKDPNILKWPENQPWQASMYSIDQATKAKYKNIMRQARIHDRKHRQEYPEENEKIIWMTGDIMRDQLSVTD